MLLDSNILIYASRTGTPECETVRAFLRRHEAAALFVSEITRVEVLGYHALLPEQRAVLAALFAASAELPITAVLDRAVHLRQSRKGLRTPDALIAATAIHHGRALVTRNVEDFDWIEALTVVDPFAPE